MICLGLDNIHNKGYIHRDFSPKNLYLKKKSKNGELIVLIGDFGLAVKA